MRRGVTLALAAALMLAMVGSLSTSARAAEGLVAVNAWVTVGSTAPAVGCTVDVAVEVRDSSGPVSNADILLGLVVDGDVIDAPRAVTDESGIAFLDVNTSGAYPGADARIEVNIAGAYADRIGLTPTSDGACAGQDALITMQAEIWKPVAEAGDDDTSTADVGGGTIIPEVGFYVQQRNLSCEYASLYIATAAWYNPISEYAFDELVGWSPNPHWGFRGDINGWWGNTTDYGVYAQALVGPLAQFGFVGEVIYGAGDPSALTARLDAGIPVVVWLGLWGDTSFYESLEDGTTYKLASGYHVGVAYGYDAGGVYFSDPAIGGGRYYDWDTFMWMWNVLDGMALAVAPA